MSHSRFTGTGRLLLATTVLSCCAVAQASNEKTIFAAENALYGAGYAIGKADGWMDNSLRSAIRTYQSSHGELAATGNLDPQTLSALGIAVGNNATVSGNTAPDREAAMASLGLSGQRSGASRLTVAAAPEPEAQPEPEPVLAEEPEPEVTVAEQANQEPQIEPEVATQAAQEAPADIPIEENAPETEVEAAGEETARISEPEPEPEPQRVEEPVSEPVVVATAEEPLVTLDAPTEATEETSTDVDYQLPDETTAPANPEASASPQVASSSAGATTEPDATAKSSGGFFSSLFDFLFGWLI